MSTCHSKDDFSSSQDFVSINKALFEIGMTKEEKTNIYKILAAILHLGNVVFVDNPLTEVCQIADSTKTHFSCAAKLLNIATETLEKSLLTRKMELKGSDPIM